MTRWPLVSPHKLEGGSLLWTVSHCASPQVQNVHGAFNALGGADRLTSNREYLSMEQPPSPADVLIQQVAWDWGSQEGQKGHKSGHSLAPFPSHSCPVRSTDSFLPFGKGRG